MWFLSAKEEVETWYTNYRPISLTSQLCKVFETLVRDQFIFLESNELIKDSQHGFRKGSSCLTNLLTFLDKVLYTVLMRDIRWIGCWFSRSSQGF